MSKQCLMRRELKKELMVKKHSKKREQYVQIIRDPNADLDQKISAHAKLAKIGRNASPCRLRRRCWMTGRARGVYRLVGLCRHKFRIHAMQGDIPGLHKASW